ncbi:MAG TPA: hypothetical protein V6D20_25365 [Candidatus Obscuribacterales bacterium]
MDITVVTVLKSGGIYLPEHVHRLKAQVGLHQPRARFVCLSDLALDCETIPLKHNYAGWWAKIELFRPGLFSGHVVYLDLDTDVVGSLDPLVRDNFTMLSDFYKPAQPASGVMAWSGDAPENVYDVFKGDPQDWMNRYKTAARWGDQGFIRDFCNCPIQRFGPEVCSYKVHVVRGKGIPAGASVVAYHGKPKPWEV